MSDEAKVMHSDRVPKTAGFLDAGAQNLLMTLWSISDEFTAQFMSNFYSGAHQSGDAPLALANATPLAHQATQRERLGPSSVPRRTVHPLL
jgi:CHAT domain